MINQKKKKKKKINILLKKIFFYLKKKKNISKIFLKKLITSNYIAIVIIKYGIKIWQSENKYPKRLHLFV